MRIITEDALIKELFDHPYEDTAYRAAMSVVHLSPDKSLLIGYWHAPEGSVEISYGSNVEYNYVIEGVITIETEQGGCFTAKAGDIIECGGGNNTCIYHIKEYAKTLFVVHPMSSEEADVVSSMQTACDPVGFKIKNIESDL